jgi:hypothetical protein
VESSCEILCLISVRLNESFGVCSEFIIEMAALPYRENRLQEQAV